MRSKLVPPDSYWQRLAEQFDEKAKRQSLETQIAQQQRAIALARRILILRNMPGFEDFRKALQDIRDHAVKQLTSSTATNDWLRVLQGQVQAYENILAVMQRGDERVQALEAAEKELQNELALFTRPEPKEQQA